MTATAKSPAALGPCRAREKTRDCRCGGYWPDTPVAGWQQCRCGHTKHSHAVPAATGASNNPRTKIRSSR